MQKTPLRRAAFLLYLNLNMVVFATLRGGKYRGMEQLVAREDHSLEVVSSILTPATKGITLKSSI